jgi:hypothetical protein
MMSEGPSFSGLDPVEPPSPWWKRREIAMAIAIPPVTIGLTSIGIFLVGNLIWEAATHRSIDIISALDRIRDLTMDALPYCMAIGFVIGLPIGIVRVLTQREALLTIDQESQSDQSKHH